MTTKTQPNTDVNAEKSVLGAMLINPNAIPAVLEHTQPADMWQPRHATIMEATIHAWGNGLQVDPLVVAGEMDKAGTLEGVGGSTYILDLVQASPTTANVAYHARRLADLALKRRVESAGTELRQLATTGGEADDILNRAQELIGSITRPNSQAIQRAADSLETVMADMEAVSRGEQTAGTPQPTGFPALDDVLNGGLRGGQMVIVAARPGVGKTVLSTDIARHVAITNNTPALIFSLEMNNAELVQRILAAESSVPIKDMRTGTFTSRTAWADIHRAADNIDAAPLYLDDAPNLNIMEIRAKARRLANQQKLGLIVVDYLQLLSSPGRVENRQQEVAQFSRQLKLLAKELDVPVIAVSQLNRGVETRGDDAKPRLSDLRESGSLEQDADIVMLIDRPDSKDPDHERAGEADIIIAKHRGGALATVELAHQMHMGRFSTMLGIAM